MYQVVNLFFIVAVYAAVVCAQLTLGERGLRRLPHGESAICRAMLSIVHAAFGYASFLGVQILLNVIVNGDYRIQAFGIYGNILPVVAGLGGLIVPWLRLILTGRRQT